MMNNIFAPTLQFGEMGGQRRRQKREWREERPPDFALNFLLLLEAELKKAKQLVEDFKTIYRNAQSVDLDRGILRQVVTGENQTHQDQSIALEFQDDDAEYSDLAALSKSCVTSDSIQYEPGDDLRVTSADLSVGSGDAESICDSAASSCCGQSISQAHRQQQVLQQLHASRLECIACRGHFHLHEVIHVGCIGRHAYCKDCLKHLFLLSTRDESLFPPKCCGNIIPVCLVEEIFTAEERERFRGAQVEHATDNKVYCARSGCGRFIPVKEGVDDRACCEACGHETCTYCKGKSHEGDCPADDTLRHFLDYAEEQHWQRCFCCKRVVERPDGCDHMTYGDIYSVL